MNMQVGDIIFVHPGTLVGDVIDWAENGNFSHVAIYMGDGTIIEAQGFEKVQYKPLSTYTGQYVVGHVKATQAKREQASVWWQQQLGKRYAWRMIGHLILKLVFHINRPARATSTAFICSTLARGGWAYGAGIVLTKNEDATPQDLVNSPLVYLQRP